MLTRGTVTNLTTERAYGCRVPSSLRAAFQASQTERNPNRSSSPTPPFDQRRTARAGYFEADSAAPTAAWPAARRAVSTRNGEQLT